MKVLLKDIHFELLGITRHSTKDEIKKAYRKQMKMWHPDRFPNQAEKKVEAEERSKKINEAYDLLKDYEPSRQSQTTYKSSKYYQSNEQSSYSWRTSRPKGSRLNIERIRVKSTNVYSIGYDSNSKTLQVEFRSGGVYQYYNVPEFIYDELMCADSKGKYLNQNIIYKYRYENV